MRTFRSHQVITMVGGVRANQLRDRTLQTYVQAADHALTKGIIIADTKFEFGVDANGNMVLADEVFTPDSSRYWPAAEYRIGEVQNSFDKQFVRNWLIGPESGGIAAGRRPRRRCRTASSMPPAHVISKLTNAFPGCASTTGSVRPHEPAADRQAGRLAPGAPR